MIGLDTNVLVRYLTQDDETQSPIATRLIEETLTASQPGFISLVALVEVVWVLETCYDCTKAEIVELLARLLRVRQLKVQDSDVVARAIGLFQSSSADFADCLVEGIALKQGCSHTETFDKAASRLPGMRRLTA
ncbi:PIN domain-containing protein [Methylomagnum sp.]